MFVCFFSSEEKEIMRNREKRFSKTKWKKIRRRKK
jgi:hypothetical protein